jgi:hypothetical protein
LWLLSCMDSTGAQFLGCNHLCSLSLYWEVLVMETCTNFEKWWAETYAKASDENTKEIAWAAWEEGSLQIGLLIKELADKIRKADRKKYGFCPTEEERDWMFEELRKKRESVA